MSRLFYLFLAFILAFIGQRWLTGGSQRDAFLLFLAGGVLLGWQGFAPAAWPALPARRKWKYVGMGLSGAALALAGLAMTRFWMGEYSGWAFWAWIAAIPLFLIGAWLEVEGQGSAVSGQGSEVGSQRAEVGGRWALVLLALILIVAAGARFYQLDIYPNGCQSDECNNGLDALKWLGGAPYTPYAETNEGQATLFTYLIALSIRLFGQSVTSMRMVSAAAGTLTVLALYFLAKELYGQRTALLAAALVAADRWHITFSRIVYELILMPLVLCLQVLFLIKALKTGRRRWWALSGLLLALGMNTYTAYRVVPAFFAVYFLYWLITHRQRVWRDLEGMIVFAAGAVVGVAPLGVYIIRNWNVFISRINHISVFRDVEAAGSYAPLWSNLRKTLLMFNVQGDSAALNNLPGAALLQPLVAAVLVLAVLWALRWFWRELPALYLVWFVAVASLGVLSVAHEAPTARRPIGLVPVIYLLAAAVIDQLWQGWEQTWGQGRDGRRWRPLGWLLGAGVILVMAANLNTYFRVQAVDENVWAAYSPNESAVGEYLAGVPEATRIYMTPQYTHHSAVKFIGGPHEIVILNLAQHVPLREDPGVDIAYLLEPVDERLVPLLQQLYPAGTYQVHRDLFARPLFLTYDVPASALDAARGLQVSYLPGDEAAQPPLAGGQTGALDIDFAATPAPLAPPFIARYEGALLAPQFGDYTLVLTVEGGEDTEAVLYLDDAEALRARAENPAEQTVRLQRTLAGGFQSLRIEYRAGATPGRLHVQWQTPLNPALTTIEPASLYTLPGAANGLVGYYYANGDWSGTPGLIQRDLFILPNNILREPFSIRWVGKVAAPVSGQYIFGTRSDDGSLVLVNGQLVVDNSGSHGSEYREGVITLTEGFHEIEVKYNELGGSREMQLWWQPPGSAKSLIPSAYLYPAEGGLPVGLVLPPLPELLPPVIETPIEEEPMATLPEPGGETRPVQVAPASPMGEFPLAEPAVLWTYGVCGAGAQDLQKPIGVAMDAEGFVYVADMGNSRVMRLSPEGEFVTSWGERGEGPGRFTEVFDVVVTPAGEVAALDAVNQVISLWTPAGEFVSQFGADLTMYRPRGLGISTAGEYFVADTGGVRVLHVTAEGGIVAQYGGPESELGPGQPTDAAASPDGQVFVAEPIAGLLWRLDLRSGDLERFAGPEANTIESPHLAVSSDGRIWLTDPEGGRVLVLSSGVQPLAQFGGRGAGEGQFGRPVGIAVGGDGRVAVSDPDLCRVTMFSGLP